MHFFSYHAIKFPVTPHSRYSLSINADIYNIFKKHWTFIFDTRQNAKIRYISNIIHEYDVYIFAKWCQDKKITLKRKKREYRTSLLNVKKLKVSIKSLHSYNCNEATFSLYDNNFFLRITKTW